MYEQVDEKLAVLTDGGRKMAMLVHERLRASVEALFEGDFAQAHDRAQEAVTKLGLLAHAQGSFEALARGSTIIRAREVCEGMEVIGWGVATADAELIEQGDALPGARLRWRTPQGTDHDRVLLASAELMVNAP